MSAQLPPAWAKHMMPTAKLAQQQAAPENIIQVLQQGVALQRNKQFLEAERIYQHVLQRQHDHPEALHLMGTLALEAEDPDVALEYFEKAVKGKPCDPYFNYNYGNTLLEVGAFEDALKYLRKAAELKPNLVEAHCGLGQAYVKLNRAAMALPFYEKAIGLNRAHPQVCLGLGNALINLGRMDEAVVYLNETIERGVGVAGAYVAIVSTRKFMSSPPELGAILACIAKPETSIEERGSFHYAPGKILNDLKCYDEAMDHYEQAKLISARSFDLQQYRK
jgi:tetratricopeptide (TPR) repeat protein